MREGVPPAMLRAVVASAFSGHLQRNVKLPRIELRSIVRSIRFPITSNKWSSLSGFMMDTFLEMEMLMCVTVTLWFL